VLATGSRAAPVTDGGDPGAHPPGVSEPLRIDALALLRLGPGALPDGRVLVDDPIGGPIGVAMAEWLVEAGRTVSLVTQDLVAGSLLSRTGDLADANTRLQRAGVHRELRTRLCRAAGGRATLEDVFTGEQRSLACAAVVDCGHRLPEETLYRQRPGTRRAGDCVAPRTVLEAVLEGRRQALDLVGVAVPGSGTVTRAPAAAAAGAVG
jgi:hypothetical protein